MPSGTTHDGEIVAAVEALRDELDGILAGLNADDMAASADASQALAQWVRDLDAALGRGVTYEEWRARFGGAERSNANIVRTSRGGQMTIVNSVTDCADDKPAGITLTPEQQTAVDALTAFPTSNGGVSLYNPAALVGFAGTGKTTTVSELLRVFKAQGLLVQLVAPTGKAAMRLREVTGRADASTIHSWLYNPIEDPVSGETRFERKQTNLMNPAKVVIVDESSMLSNELWRDVRAAVQALRARVIYVGDGFQLPPVQAPGEPPFCVFDIAGTEVSRLTQVVRQAAGNPIIAASMDIRQGAAMRGLRPLQISEQGDLLVQRAIDGYRQGGITIVHRNATRVAMNARMRVQGGVVQHPNNIIQPGEPLLVRKNNGAIGKFNGEIVKFLRWLEVPSIDRSVIDYQTKARQTHHYGLAELEGCPVPVVLCHQELVGTTVYKAGDLARAIRGQWTVLGIDPVTGEESERQRPYLSANLGYCATAHSAQGSQWDDVLVLVEPSIKLNKEEGLRWCYTAVTRAAKTCAVHMGGL